MSEDTKMIAFFAFSLLGLFLLIAACCAGVGNGSNTMNECATACGDAGMASWSWRDGCLCREVEQP